LEVLPEHPIPEIENKRISLLRTFIPLIHSRRSMAAHSIQLACLAKKPENNGE
jgi:hypothetical protein